ncbi:MAG TPA: hypothetical protein VKM94_17145 [Blastocatellia bacterium]|nr:hypothetical protein [Blastocatellia bacterium]
MKRKCESLLKAAWLLILLLALTTEVSAQAFKTGVYSATSGDVKWSIKYEEGGKVTVSRNGELLVEGTYKVKGDELELTDKSGAMSCGADKAGKYKWKLEGKKLSFTMLTDECEGRATALTSQAWTLE